MSDIFLSYSREDKARAKAFVDLLEQKGWSVWWDPDIAHGKKFRDVIQRELDAAKCAIVLWSVSSVLSDWVLDEAGEAKERNILVPVLIDHVKLPRGFGQLQTSLLTDWTGNPNHPELKQLLQSTASILGQHSAIRYRAIDPSTSQGVANYHYNRGRELAKQNKYDEAVSEYKLAIGIYSEDSSYHWYLAYALNELGRPDEAAIEYRESLRLEPKEASALNNLGLILYRKGEYTEAEALFRQAIDSDPNDALYHNNLGNALARQAEAESPQQEPSTDPPFAFPRTMSEFTTSPFPYEQPFGRRASRKMTRLSAPIVPQSSRLDALLGPAARFSGFSEKSAGDTRWKEAEAAYRKAAQLAPTKGAYHNRLGDALRAQFQYADAEAAYREAVKRDPDDAQYHNNLGAVLEAQSKTQEAEREYAEASRLDPFGVFRRNRSL